MSLTSTIRAQGATVDGEATTRILRLISGAFGVGSLVFGLLAYQSIIEQYPLFNPVWTWSSIVVMFGAAMALGVVATWATARMIRRTMGGIAIGYLLSMLTMLPALGDNHVAFALGSPWILGITALGTTAAALAWKSFHGVGLYLVVISITVGVNRGLASDIDATATAIEDALWGLCYDTIFASLALVSVRAGARLDEAAASARAKVLVAADTLARSQERARAEALVHDGVLATLLAASRDSDADRSAARTQASSALRLLEEFRWAPPSRGTSGRAFVWKLQSLTTQIAAEAEFSYEIEGSEEIPADVGNALAEAAGEALRNTMRHADRPDRRTQRAVHVRTTDEGVSVAILDDGKGFEPNDVSPRRMGIAVSIRGRMERLENGRVRIASAPDDGTRVLLEWRRP